MSLIVFCAQREGMQQVFRQVLLPALKDTHTVLLARTPGDLDQALAGEAGAVVFCTDWSWRIPADALKANTFVGFHAADLPKYRGGTPIQHQIRDGLTETKLTAFAMSTVMDGGDVLLQEPLSLQGTIAEIWERIAALVGPMCLKYLAGEYERRPQALAVDPANKRIRPEQSKLPDMNFSLLRLYDLIRGLDGPGYPHAYLEIDGKRIEFTDAVYMNGMLGACVRITELGT